MELQKVAKSAICKFTLYKSFFFVAHTSYANSRSFCRKINSQLRPRSTQTCPLTGVQLQQIWPKEKEWKTRAREQQKQMLLVYIQISQIPPKQLEQLLVFPDSDFYASIASNQQLLQKTITLLVCSFSSKLQIIYTRSITSASL